MRVAAQGIADYLNSERARIQSPLHKLKPVVVLGHDTRFLGREFSLAAAEVLAANELIPLLCQRDAPTPVIAHTIRVRKAIGGVNMTASHNPAEYQGLKFSVFNGAAAPPEVTQEIEIAIRKRQEAGWTFPSMVVGTFKCKEIDPRPVYFKQIRKLIDFDTLRRAKLRVAGIIRNQMPKGWHWFAKLFVLEKRPWVSVSMATPTVSGSLMQMALGSPQIRSWPCHCII